jgi:hypothetical protein
MVGHNKNAGQQSRIHASMEHKKSQNNWIKDLPWFIDGLLN